MNNRKSIPWDLIIAILGAIGIYLSLPYHLPEKFLKEIYLAGLIVLAIIFAEFFASVMAVPAFLNKIQDQEPLKPRPMPLKEGLFLAKLSLSSLVYFTMFYFYTAYCAQTNPVGQNKTWLMIGSLLFFYTLFAFFGALWRVLDRSPE